MRDILAIGANSYDMISVIPRMPGWEEIEYIEDFQIQQGGMAATAIVAASKLGASAEFMGGIGVDFQGDFMKENFRRYGVECGRMQVFPGEISAFTIVLVDKDTSRRTIIHKKGVVAKAELLEGDIDLSGLRFVLFDGFYFDTILRTARRAAELGITSVTDLSPRNRDPRIPEFLRLIDYPILSELFLKPYCGMSDPVEAARSLFGGRNKAMLVTCGEQGVHIVRAGSVEHVGAFKVNSIDTTGAGDVFHGAFLFALWKGYPLREATVFASAVSAMKCTKLGGQSGIPSFPEVREFITERMPSSAAWL